MEDRFVKLTNAVYKVLEFFPEADPLKNRAKDKALVIMDNLSLSASWRIGTEGWASLKTCLPAGRESAKHWLSEDIDLLLSYLKIGEKQGWLSSINYIIISNEYEKLKKEIRPVSGYPAKEMTQKLPNMEPVLPVLLDNAAVEKVTTKVLNLSGRQTKILKFLEEKEKAQVMDLQTVLPDITKRTIRRDLDELLKMGKIIRIGEWNQVVYKLPEKLLRSPTPQ